LCTENLTPFLALLPSKGLSGLSSLLAQPGIIFSWGFKTEGIEVIMPDALTGQSGQWRGWWEGIVELVPPNQERRRREFSLQSLFKKNIPLPFPEAEESVLRVIMPEEGGTGLQVEHEPDTTELRWLDGRLRTVKEWDLVQTGLIGQDLKFWWDEDRFQYRKSSTDLHKNAMLIAAISSSVSPSFGQRFADCYSAPRL
jgi:phosphatidylinositol glycan class T